MADKLLKYDVAMKSTKTVWQMETPRCYTGDENTVTFDFNITDLEAADLVGVIPNVYLYMRDGSFFQNGPADGVEITGTIVNYTMKGNEGKHSGIARAQLVLVWDDEINPPEKLTSQLYDFEVVSGLENKVAVEVMIQDWTTLTREARTFIDTSSDEVDALKGELQTAINTANASLGEFDVAMETGIVAANLAEKLEDFEEINNSRLLSTERQLAETFTTLDARLEDIEQQISDNAIIMGVYWNKTSSPTLTRTDASVGKIAAAGVAGATVHNDFDNMPIYSEMGTVTDTYGNEFIKIPKFYIKKTDGVGFKTIKISKTKYPDYYLPAVFWDFENQVELQYYLHGKYKANLSADNLRLESKPATFPLQSKNIVQFRDYAKANNNVGAALKGYQQLDIHAQDVLYCLFTVEFATLNSQSIMQGFSTGRYTATDLVTVASTAANTIIVANATADLYKVGQTVSLGTSQGGHQVFYSRQILSITVHDGTNKAITVDGAPFNAAVGNMLYNTGAKSGFSADVNASSGTPIANDGKYPCVYRGIESPWGDMWQFVDGVNISDLLAWVCRNADQYASNVFASPYEKVGYVNGNTNGYLKYKGFDKLYPFAELPKEVGGDSATYYSDYYYQATGQRIALVGGGWTYGSNVGLSFWNLNASSTYASADIGGRLLKKAL